MKRKRSLSDGYSYKRALVPAGQLALRLANRYIQGRAAAPTNNITQTHVSAPSSHCSTSYFRGPTRRSLLPKGIKKLTARQTLTTNSTTRLQLRPGCQTAQTLNATYTSAAGSGPTYPFVWNNEISNRITAIIANPPLIPTSAPTRYLLESVRTAYVIKNQTNVCVEMDLYTCVPKRDIYDLTQQALEPISSFINGLNTQAIPGGSGPSSINFIGTTPYMSPTFCQLYTVRKKITVNLGPGGQHEHIFKMRPNCVISNPIANTYDASRNYSFFVLAIVRGTTTETTSAATPAHAITTAFGEVICMAESAYQWSVVEKSTPTWYRETNVHFEESAGPFQPQNTITEGYNVVDTVKQT